MNISENEILKWMRNNGPYPYPKSLIEVISNYQHWINWLQIKVQIEIYGKLKDE